MIPVIIVILIALAMYCPLERLRELNKHDKININKYKKMLDKIKEPDNMSHRREAMKPTR